MFAKNPGPRRKKLTASTRPVTSVNASSRTGSGPWPLCCRGCAISFPRSPPRKRGSGFWIPAFAEMSGEYSEPNPRQKLEIHLVAALKRQDLARFIGRGDFEAEALDDLAHLGDLLRVGLGKLAGPEPQRVLHADTHVAAHRQNLSRHTHLRGAGAERRPFVIVTEQAIGSALHHHDIFGMRADAAADPEHALHEQP